MGSFSPRTPAIRTGKGLDLIIEDLNFKFDIQLPNPSVSSPSSRENDKSLAQQCFKAIRFLYWKRDVEINKILEEFEEEVRANTIQWTFKPRQEPGTLPRSNNFLRRDDYREISDVEREKRIRALKKLLDNEIYLINGGSFPQSHEKLHQPRDLTNGPKRPSDQADFKAPLQSETTSTDPKDQASRPQRSSSHASFQVPQVSEAVRAGPRDNGRQRTDNGASFQAPVQLETKRKSFEDEEVFCTAPSSPIISPEASPSLGDQDEFDDPSWDDSFFDTMSTTDDMDIHDGQKPQAPQSLKKTKKRQSRISDYMNVTKPDRSPGLGSKDVVSEGFENDANVSFATTVESDIFDSRDPCMLGRSFDTDITEPMHETMTQLEKKVLGDLLENGPFAARRPTFPNTVSLRTRYELERIAQEWKSPPNLILAGTKDPFTNYEKFWQWLESHGQRRGRSLPEKSPARAWDAAVDRFKANAHSQVVVFTGVLYWCDKAEKGIFKLKLNPLKIERSCRFNRRFGSDRFLSITIPAPSRPPSHLRFHSHPSFLRETISKWLTRSDHGLLGRKWRAFYVEEVKAKRKKPGDDIRFRVDFFAVDGIGFLHYSKASDGLAPPNQPFDKHTTMSVKALLDWHLWPDRNSNQDGCKLFQRIALGLSKTWATVVLRPEEVLHLQDEKDKPVMNDGCALMSKALAREICDNLGLRNTPSSFQGRIAGAKGLWMVDKHNSPIQAGDRDFWIQISDSQLKVKLKPHPHYWFGSPDDEQLTFEVANWSKPLHPVELNMQLLAILENGGQVREYVAQVMRDGIRETYEAFAAVIETDSIPAARALIQKVSPPPYDGFSRNSRRIGQWILDNTESIIRLLEAGFSPRNFVPLRTYLRQCLTKTLNRYVEELHIPIPLSTYAYCIADPYGVLGEDEVHFSFSSQWQEAQFEENMVNGMDVLVGRLPAHRPSDIQRRRAVFNLELQHFKDVIVFPTRGDVPLAHLLSGGDYDGDKPWICWDKNIVESFRNSFPPPDDLPPSHFGLTKYSQSMREVSTEEFLENTFRFNLTLSNLGRCTVEHEKIVYDEPESVDSPKAKELAMLLSHLVDGRKGGLQLSENAWQQYRKKISPRKRGIPAYKQHEDSCKPKSSNIIDYLKFDVAQKEKDRVLTQFQNFCDGLETRDMRDRDLLRPWQKAWTRAESERNEQSDSRLYDHLKEIREEVENARDLWSQFCSSTIKRPFSFITQHATDLIKAIRPPKSEHPLSYTWQNSEYEWQRLVASCTYDRFRDGSFVWNAVGETLCQIKTGNAPARLVRDLIYLTLKVNSKVLRRLAAVEVDAADVDAAESLGSDEFEGKEAIEAFTSFEDDGLPGGMATLDYFDDDDGLSVE